MIQRSLKKAMKDPAAVTGLDLRQEKPVLLFPEIGQFINLEFIDLSNCQNLHWEDACIKLSTLPKLTELKAFGANIQSLPEEFGLLKKLKRIDFSSNADLSFLPESFSSLVELEEINLYGCGLKTMPSTNWNFPNLRTLTLSKNKLQVFPVSFFSGLTNLQELTISDNQLECLPDSICGLKNLRSLLAGNNPLKTLPDNFSLLSSLESLWLDTCANLDMEKELRKTKDLPIKNLSVLGNNISSLPAAFKKLSSLEILNINSNKLDDTQQLLKDLSNLPLKELDIRFMGKEKILLEDAQKIIPTLNSIATDSRTADAYAADTYNWLVDQLQLSGK